jgi:hypothetical protein
MLRCKIPRNQLVSTNSDVFMERHSHIIDWVFQVNETCTAILSNLIRLHSDFQGTASIL